MYGVRSTGRLQAKIGRNGRMFRSRGGQTRGSDPDAWSSGLARAKIGIGLASARFAADTKKAMDGLAVSRRKGGGGFM